MSTTSRSPSADTGFPAEYAALVDDAALFPPGSAPLPDAVRDYRAYDGRPIAPLVGPFVVGDTRLPDLLEVLAEREDAVPLPVTVVVSGGAGSLEPAARWAEGSPLVDLRGLEVALRDLDDLPGAARRTVAAADLGLEVPVFVELPMDQVGRPGWLAALDEVALADLRAKFRTGGVEAALFPGPGTLAAAIEAALDREVPFKCTAGLHHAVRHQDPSTGFAHHGFLNVLLGVRAALDGEDVAAVLAESDPAAVADRARASGSEALRRARRWFTSFGCCGATEPWEDLRALGLA